MAGVLLESLGKSRKPRILEFVIGWVSAESRIDGLTLHSEAIRDLATDMICRSFPSFWARH